MSKKIDRAAQGPGWAEVILGAILSLVLGVVIGAAVLIFKPVTVAKEMPKEPAPGTVYWLQGVVDASKAKQAMAKRQAFLAGQSVKVTEDELNSLAVASKPPAPAPAPTKKGEKPAPAAAPANANEMLATGTPNVRIRDGSLQVGVPVTINVLGFSQPLVAQARGGFEKDGAVFAYAPHEMYLGSCPVDKLPFLSSYVRSKLLASHPIPDDIAAAWAKVTNVTIEGNALNLAMQ